MWHVKNMRVLHKNKEEVTKFIEYMKGIYEEKMPVARGKKHAYVKMDLEYSSLGELVVSMDTTEVIDRFPEEMTKTTKTPAGNHLLKVDDTCVK